MTERLPLRLGKTPHPILLALLPVLFMYAQNMGGLHLRELWRPLLAAAGAGLVTWGLLRVVLKDWTRAAVLTSAFWVWFCSFGHVWLLQTRMAADFFPLVAVLYSLLWPAALVVAIDRTWEGRRLSTALNLMAVALVAMQVVHIGSFEWRRAHTVLPAPPAHSTIRVTGAPKGPAPNIYFIVLDGYGRSDVLRERYDYDNRDFLQFLESRGFQVAPRARANYCQTALSVTSCLNLGYLDEVARAMGPKSSDRSPLTHTLNDNETTRFLRQQGYLIEAFAPGYNGTVMRSADVYREGFVGLSEFENAVLETTPFLRAIRGLGMYRETPAHVRARQILYTFDHLAEAGRSERPAFIFAHIIAPHPPFVFHADGSFEWNLIVNGFADSSNAWGSPEVYVKHYREQIQFITACTRKAIEDILAQAPRPTAIILLSDHGPGSTLDWVNMQGLDLKERFGTLVAVRLPESTPARIPEDITTVNVLRFVLRDTLGADLPPLPSISYASPLQWPYDFTRVTNAQGELEWPKEKAAARKP